MCSDLTIQQVRSALLAPLLPTERLRNIAEAPVVHEIGFDALTTDKTDAEFVALAYQHLMGRQPGPECLATWTGHLTSDALSRAEIVVRLSESPEGRVRGMIVHGLDYALAVSGKKLSTRWNGWRTWMRRSSRQKKHVKSLDPLSAAAVSDKLVQMEQRITRAVDDCLHVFEHIEHRFSKQPTRHIVRSIVHLPRKVTSRKNEERGEIDSRVRLHSRMNELLVEQPVAECDLLMETRILQVQSLLRAEHRGLPWLVGHSEVHQVIATCRRLRIAIGAMSTTAVSADYVRGQGIKVAEGSVAQLLKSMKPNSVGAVWLNGEALQCGDDELIENILESQRALIPDGVLIVEVTATKRASARFQLLRLRAAMDICSLETMTSSFSAGSENHSEDSLWLVAKNVKGQEVIDYA